MNPDVLEAEWLQQTALGNRSAFEQLFRAYHNRVFAYLSRTLGSTQAEEVTSDVMLNVWLGAGKFRGDSRVSTWIFGIAHHKGMSALRGSRPSTVDVDEAVQVVDPKELQDDILTNEETRNTIGKAMARLSQQHKEVLHLAFYQDLSCAEIASVLQCPVNTVKTRMFYARKHLRGLLGQVAQREA